MRLRIQHQTTYAYDRPALSVIQVLRLTPRNHEGQTIRNWRIELDHDGLLKAGEDSFGNIIHTISLAGPLEGLVITVTGEVETQNTNSIVRGTLERFPERFYLRETALTKPDAAIREFANDSTSATTDALSKLHSLLTAVHSTIVFDTKPTDATTSAIEAFGMKRGVCQDLSHVFIACARSLGIPARYIGGYLLRDDGKNEQDAGHAWTEAHVDGLGWVGFDAANGICQTEAHVRVSAGLDYLSAAPVRGSRYGGAEERLQVSINIGQASGQATGPARNLQYRQTSSQQQG